MSLDCNCRVEVPVKRGSRSLRGVACFAAAVILFLTLRSGVFGLFQPLSVAAAQLAVFPLVILCLGQVVFLSQKLPAQLMVVAVAAALVAAALRYNWKRAEVGTVYLARLQGDEFETSTRVLRESLNAELRSYGKVKIVGYPAEVSHASEVSRVFNADPNALAVVWGSDSWLQVSLPGVITRELGEMGLDPELGAPANLKVVMEVPRFGVSMKPRRETASFLAALFSGLKGVRLKAGSGHVRGIEPDLLSAVMIESPWRGLSHKGYAWWLLGNLYLNEVFAGGGHNRAALHCARRAYGRAAGLVLLDSNPSLFTAIHNNIGVVRYLQGMFEAVADAPERALKSWRLALTGSRQELWRKLSVRRIVSQENLAAFENLRLVQPVGEGGKTVKRSNTKSKRRKTHVKRPRSARSVGARAEKD